VTLTSSISPEDRALINPYFTFEDGQHWNDDDEVFDDRYDSDLDVPYMYNDDHEAGEGW
jgi:hypothetical protein